VCVDSWFESLVAVIFLALLCVIVYVFSMNMRTLIRSDLTGSNSALFRWRLHLSFAATCVAGMLTVLVAFQAVILALFMTGTQLDPQTVLRSMSASIRTIWEGLGLVTVGLIQYFWLDLWAKRKNMKRIA